MSKSRGNVVNPDDVVDAHGADALRLYEMFMGPLEAVKPWQTSQVAGVVRFQNKLYNVVQQAAKNDASIEMDDETTKIVHKTMKKVTEDIESMSFNTAISAMMVLTNHLTSLKDQVPFEAAEKLVLMISPFAPHLGEVKPASRVIGQVTQPREKVIPKPKQRHRHHKVADPAGQNTVRMGKGFGAGRRRKQPPDDQHGADDQGVARHPRQDRCQHRDLPAVDLNMGRKRPFDRGLFRHPEFPSWLFCPA